MTWFLNTFSGTIGRKIIVSFSGLFLILFLIGHLIGNLQLIFANGQTFNIYAKFMTTNIGVKALSYLTYLSILLHALYGLIISIKNRQARPVKYFYNSPGANSTLSSRNMGILGTIILLFIVVHMYQFWHVYKFDEIPYISYTIDGVTQTYKDLHVMVLRAFQNFWYVALYVFSMATLGFHLYHGFHSAFQTLGLSHPKYTPFIKGTGTLFSILVPALFAAIPVYIYLKNTLGLI